MCSSDLGPAGRLHCLLCPRFRAAPLHPSGLYALEPEKSGHGIKGIFGSKKIPAGKGMVQIKTSPPGAEVIYKGTVVQQRTPLKVPLDPGNHRVTIKLKGYRTLQKDFVVLEGKSIDVIVELQPK